MEIPAGPEFIGIARLAVSGVGNHLGFCFTEIEELCLAVEAACLKAAKNAPEGVPTSIQLFRSDQWLVVKVEGLSNKGGTTVILYACRLSRRRKSDREEAGAWN